MLNKVVTILYLHRDTKQVERELFLPLSLGSLDELRQAAEPLQCSEKYKERIDYFLNSESNTISVLTIGHVHNNHFVWVTPKPM